MTETNGRAKMGRKLREEICGLYKGGATMQEIARKTGWSKSTVCRVIHKRFRGDTFGQRARRRAESIIYPGLREWFIDSGASFAEAANVCDVNCKTMSIWMMGGGKECIPKRAIDTLLMWTGMTYEKAFGDPRKQKEDIEA